MKLIRGDCLERLRGLGHFNCAFVDPPDNIGLGYDTYDDKRSEGEYREWLATVVFELWKHAPIVWISFNARWTLAMSAVVSRLTHVDGFEFKPCVQTFSFGQHNRHDLGNNHRPLWRLRHRDAPLYPDAVREPSWRLLNGDKRADPRGRVPGDVLEMPDDVFRFPRVVGNAKQRRRWHPTQLHQGLVERCLKLSCKPGDRVLDPCAGTGTTLRVAEGLGLDATGIEIDPGYCQRIAEENGLTEVGRGVFHKEPILS